MTSHTAPLTPQQAELLRCLLKERDYEFTERPHAMFSARHGKLNVTVYHKGPKVLIQGKGTREFIEFTLEPEILRRAGMGYEEVLDPEQFEPHFGIDESGKGDFFGPLVIAGVFTDSALARALIEIGVTDSKLIKSSAQIRRLAAEIRAVPGVTCEVVSIGPARYNELYATFKNLNRLLAWGHARVIEMLIARRPDCPRALSDQFARREVLERALRDKGLQIQLDQRTGGESDVAVAAASILARERFVDWMEKTSAAGGVKLPFGASAAVVTAGREVVKKHGAEALGKVAKLHFRTTQQVLGDLF
ncbi:MAG: ribonuclease HIII, partial [Luteolibacter sp.]